MFEHFGLKDVFYGLWRRIGIIITITCVFVGIGAIYYSQKDTEITINEQYCSSKTYYVSDKRNYLENDGSNKTPANVLDTVLGSDFCNQYVTEKILSEYSKEEVIHFLDLNITEEEFNIHQIKKGFVHQVMGDNYCLNIFSTTSNEEFSHSILDTYSEYLKNIVESRLTDFEILELGGADQVIKEEERDTWGCSKTIVFWGCLGFGIAVSLIFVYILFFPTMNRKSDFENLGIHVFGDVEENR